MKHFSPENNNCLGSLKFVYELFHVIHSTSLHSILSHIINVLLILFKLQNAHITPHNLNCDKYEKKVSQVWGPREGGNVVFDGEGYREGGEASGTRRVSFALKSVWTFPWEKQALIYVAWWIGCLKYYYHGENVSIISYWILSKSGVISTICHPWEETINRIQFLNANTETGLGLQPRVSKFGVSTQKYILALNYENIDTDKVFHLHFIYKSLREMHTEWRLGQELTINNGV